MYYDRATEKRIDLKRGMTPVDEFVTVLHLISNDPYVRTVQRFVNPNGEYFNERAVVILKDPIKKTMFSKNFSEYKKLAKL